MFRSLMIVGLTISLSTLAEHARGDVLSTHFINADQVHAQGIEGQCASVVVLDNGVDYECQQLAGHIRAGISRAGGKWDCDGGQMVPCGPASLGWYHGTAMSETILAVAPQAQIYSIRAMDCNCVPRDYIDALKYIAAHKKADPTIRILNISRGSSGGGCPCDEDPRFPEERGAIADVVAADILIFAASGNESHCEDMDIPACLSQVVKVAASFDHRHFPEHIAHDYCTDDFPVPYRISCLSNFGADCTDFLAAPGVNVFINCVPIEHEQSGTSIAAAQCSGVAALMFSKAGPCGLSATAARTTIWGTAEDHTVEGNPCPESRQPKHVNALSAVNLVTGPACSPLPGDMDCDNYVSVRDFNLFVNCFTGPAAALPPVGICQCAPFLPGFRDATIDLRDFAAFQVAFTGYGSGACCHPHGECSITTVKECADEFGATYQGHNTTCEEVQCDPGDWGACWFWPAGPENPPTCEEKTRDNCIWGDTWFGDEGFYLGDGSRCATSACPTPRYRNLSEDPDHMTYTPCGDGLELADVGREEKCG